MYTEEKSIDVALGTIFRIRKSFQGSKHAETLYLFFALTRQAKNLKTICACTNITNLNFTSVQTNILFCVKILTFLTIVPVHFTNAEL
jgi:hypothetical protein